MTLHKRILLALFAGVLMHELVALGGHYPPITATVAAWPTWLVLLVALGCGVLGVHFVRAHDRRKRGQ